MTKSSSVASGILHSLLPLTLLHIVNGGCQVAHRRAQQFQHAVRLLHRAIHELVISGIHKIAPILRRRNHIFKLVGFVLADNGELQKERFERVEVEQHLLSAHFVDVLASTHTVQEARQELHRHAIAEVSEVDGREQVSNARILVTQRRGNRGNVP